MKIAAGCVFSDSWEILPAAIANLVSLGVEDFYLIDHMSVRNHGSELRSMFSDYARINLARKISTPFLQGRMMSILAELARRDGFDYFVPFDSDEFLDAHVSCGHAASSIGNLISREGIGEEHGLLMPLVQYVQSVEVQKFTVSSLFSARFIVENTRMGDGLWRKFLSDGGTPLLRPANPKIILNLNRLDDGQFYVVTEGNHSIQIGGPNQQNPIIVRSENVCLRHLPYHSQAGLVTKQNLGRRRRDAGFNATIGVQNQNLAELSDSGLKRYWKRVSYQKDETLATGVVGTKIPLIQDSGLASVLERIQSLGIDLDALGQVESRDADVLENCENSRFKEQILSVSIDSPAGFPSQ